MSRLLDRAKGIALPPELTDKDKLLLSHRQIILNKIAACKSRSDSICLLYSNDKFADCFKMLQFLALDFIELYNELKPPIRTEGLARGGSITAYSHISNSPHIVELCRFCDLEVPDGDRRDLEKLYYIVKSLPKCLTEIKNLFNCMKNENQMTTDYYWKTFHKKVLAFAAIVLLSLSIITTAAFYINKYINYRKDLAVHFDWLKDDMHPRILIAGINPPENDKNNTLFAWGTGPYTVIVINSPDETMMKLAYAIASPIPEQQATISINGIDVKTINTLPPEYLNNGKNDEIFFKTKVGQNIIKLTYADWNMKKYQWFQNEDRQLAVKFYAFSLEREKALFQWLQEGCEAGTGPWVGTP